MCLLPPINTGRSRHIYYAIGFGFFQSEQTADDTVQSEQAADDIVQSEQAADDAVLVYVDPLRCGNLGKSGHGHDIAGQGNDETCARADLEVADGNSEALGSTEQSGVIGERVLGLGHADGQSREAEVSQLFDLLDGIADQLDAVCVIDLFADHVQFLFDGSIKRIGLTEVIGLFAETDDFLCEGLAAFAALGPDFGQSDIDAELSALGLDQVELFFGIGRFGTPP